MSFVDEIRSALSVPVIVSEKRENDDFMHVLSKQIKAQIMREAIEWKSTQPFHVEYICRFKSLDIRKSQTVKSNKSLIHRYERTLSEITLSDTAIEIQRTLKNLLASEGIHVSDWGYFTEEKLTQEFELEHFLNPDSDTAQFEWWRECVNRKYVRVGSVDVDFCVFEDCIIEIIEPDSHPNFIPFHPYCRKWKQTSWKSGKSIYTQNGALVDASLDLLPVVLMISFAIE